MTVSTASFNERLSRIERERKRSAGAMVVHVGDERLRVRSLEQIAPPAREKGGRASPLLAAPALALGALSLALATAARMRIAHAATVDSVTGPGAQILGLGLAFGIAVFLGVLVGLRGRAAWTAAFLGAALASATLHNAAFLAPELSDRLFTPAWVSLTREGAAPMTLVALGFSVQI